MPTATLAMRRQEEDGFAQGIRVSRFVSFQTELVTGSGCVRHARQRFGWGGALCALARQLVE